MLAVIRDPLPERDTGEVYRQDRNVPGLQGLQEEHGSPSDKTKLSDDK